MKKKLFQNYTFEFDKNEKKVLISFCNQAIKQMQGDERFFKDIKAFDSIIKKLESDKNPVKLTKDEKTKLVFQLKENVKYFRKEMDKSWFIKKWLMKNMYNQYTNLLTKHFEN